ncbi:GreA/GreB family elongation factor [Trichloromonas sp.]|uniref:GreA/GreB family elongation factor n=1 Tax=Trichloromonas sp. TaxID=3069249 RepID=UPI002A4D6880|nr:GreA/GreB family elongation factor [Trichloromonas sp.]
MSIYMTPACAETMREELRDLLYTKRPEMARTAEWAAGNGDRSENADYQYAKRALRRFDSRIRFLSKRLESAQIIDPAAQGKIAGGKVLFGATVTVDEGGEEKDYSIVGIDETAPGRGVISWVSPLGKALLGKREGDVVTFSAPKGERELEILKVEYRPIAIGRVPPSEEDDGAEEDG